MKNFTKILSLAMICGGLVSGITTQAGAGTVTTTEKIMLNDNDRMLLGNWVIFNNQGCPPGSTRVKTSYLIGKPTYRCVVPPGRTMTFYGPGAILPRTVIYEKLPGYVLEDLPPPPAGTSYVSANGNVYLINPDTRTVVESVRIVGPAD